ncbi:MAG: hypothetical protein J0G32_07465 [Alphaproteobacteria bacterium]|nr:hypothetical protein [Alphaproteobacteria bacterium]OJV12164.1 MAG: hypothetical protein BGO27_05440 [Alphaproteobacteria bacterium 33-17]
MTTSHLTKLDEYIKQHEAEFDKRAENLQKDTLEILKGFLRDVTYDYAKQIEAYPNVKAFETNAYLKKFWQYKHYYLLLGRDFTKEANNLLWEKLALSIDSQESIEKLKDLKKLEELMHEAINPFNGYENFAENITHLLSLGANFNYISKYEKESMSYSYVSVIFKARNNFDLYTMLISEGMDFVTFLTEIDINGRLKNLFGLVSRFSVDIEMIKNYVLLTDEIYVSKRQFARNEAMKYAIDLPLLFSPLTAILLYKPKQENQVISSLLETWIKQLITPENLSNLCIRDFIGLNAYDYLKMLPKDWPQRLVAEDRIKECEEKITKAVNKAMHRFRFDPNQAKHNFKRFL